MIPIHVIINEEVRKRKMFMRMGLTYGLVLGTFVFIHHKKIVNGLKKVVIGYVNGIEGITNWVYGLNGKYSNWVNGYVHYMGNVPLLMNVGK